MAPSKSIVGGNFQDALGNLITGNLLLVLSQDAQISGTGQLAPTHVRIPINGGSVASTPIWFNDQLQPNNLTYTATAYDSTGNKVYGPELWSLTGGSPLDLSTLTPLLISPDPLFANPVLQNPALPQTITGQGLTLTSTAPLTIQSLLTVTGLMQCKNFENIRCLDGVNYTSMASAYADLPASGGTVMVVPGYTETMSASLTVNKTNSGFLFMGPATITMGTNQVIVPAATQGVYFRSLVTHAGGGDISNAVRFVYTGTGSAFQIGANTTTTRNFSFDDILITVSGSATAVGIYLTNVVYWHMTRPSVVGDNVNAAKGIVCDGTGNFCGNATIQDPHLVNLGTGILGTGTGSQGMNSVSIIGGERITSSIVGSIAIDIEAGSENTIFGPDFESTTTGLKLGAGALRNYAVFRSEATGTDVVALAGSADNRVMVIDSPGPMTKSDSGTNNQFAYITDISARNASVSGIVTTPQIQAPSAGNIDLVDNLGVSQLGIVAGAARINHALALGAGVPIADASSGVHQSVTLKKGSGAGNYTTVSTTYVVVDSTNLCNTVTIPTGWKLGISASGAVGTATAAVLANVALTDNAACSTANAGILVESVETTTAAGVLQPWALNWVINGDGNTHNIALQYKTSNGADSATLLNSSGTSLPTMVFTLMPSN